VIILVFVTGITPPKPRELSWDEIDRHVPLKDETVSLRYLALQSSIIPFAIVGWIIYLKLRKEKLNSISYRRQLTICYRCLMSYISLMIVINSIVEISKRMFGRPRPFFLQLCYGSEEKVPELSDIPPLLTNKVCMSVNAEVTERDLNFARLSFPSGHSAIAASTSIWTGLFADELIQYYRVPSGKGVFSSIMVLLLCNAIWIGSSRLTDNRHHPGDILAGFILGMVTAVWQYFAYKPIIPSIEIIEGREDNNPESYVTFGDPEWSKYNTKATLI